MLEVKSVHFLKHVFNVYIVDSPHDDTSVYCYCLCVMLYDSMTSLIVGIDIPFSGFSPNVIVIYIL